MPRFELSQRVAVECRVKAQFLDLAQALGADFEKTPEAVEREKWAAQSAGWFWATNGCNALADAGDYEAITRRINGGLIGYDDRVHWLAKVRDILGTPND